LLALEQRSDVEPSQLEHAVHKTPAMIDFKTGRRGSTSLGKLDFFVAPLLGLVFGR
jgi:hypothetical protein